MGRQLLLDRTDDGVIRHRPYPVLHPAACAGGRSTGAGTGRPAADTATRIPAPRRRAATPWAAARHRSRGRRSRQLQPGDDEQGGEPTESDDTTVGAAAAARRGPPPARPPPDLESAPATPDRELRQLRPAPRLGGRTTSGQGSASPSAAWSLSSRRAESTRARCTPDGPGASAHELGRRRLEAAGAPGPDGAGRPTG